MSFDPFDDFETRGYLRNVAGEKDLDIVKRLEHRAFLAKLDIALSRLAAAASLSYKDILSTHKLLFETVYPWAGQERAQIAPNIAVSKGPVLFAHPNDARAAAEFALRIGQDPAAMATRPGEVMGYLVYGHPFLDGNGRTILTVRTELAQRAGISIDWAATDKAAYLTALTRELDTPGKGILDSYLKPFVGPSVGHDRLAGHITRTPGLDGSATAPNEVLGRFSDPALQARYKAQAQRRQDGDRLATLDTGRATLSGDVPAEKREEAKSAAAEKAKTARDFSATRDTDTAGRARERDKDGGNRPGRGGGSRGGRGR